MLDATLELSWQKGSPPAESQSYALDVNAGGVPAVALASRVPLGETLYLLAPAEADAARLRLLQEKIARSKRGEPNRGSLSAGSPDVADVAPSRQAERSWSMPGCRWGRTRTIFRCC